MFFDVLTNLDEVLKQLVCELLWKTFELVLSSIPNFKFNEDVLKFDQKKKKKAI